MGERNIVPLLSCGRRAGPRLYLGLQRRSLPQPTEHQGVPLRRSAEVKVLSLGSLVVWHWHEGAGNQTPSSIPLS